MDSNSSNITVWLQATPSKPHVADAKFDRNVRIIVLSFYVVLGTIGGALVCLWLWVNRKRKSRVNKIITQVAISDLLVIFCACLPQLIWECFDRDWLAGEAFCKIYKYLTSFAMMASNFMLVMLTVDRHEAIMYPLREPPRVWVMAAVSWAIAALCSLPQFGIFHQNYVTDPGPFQNKTVCESIFRYTEPWARQAYLTYISVVVFYIPFIIIAFCYIRIFVKIAGRVNENNISTESRHNNQNRPGKITLVSSQTNSTLSKAKVKILKMSIVIIVCFIICNMPYHLLEMIYSYGDHTKVPPMVSAILGAMAVANSAVNPFVFLVFNANRKCMSHFLPCCIKAPDGRPSVYDSTINRGYYPGQSATCLSEVTRLDSRSKTPANPPPYTRINSTDT